MKAPNAVDRFFAYTGLTVEAQIAIMAIGTLMLFMGLFVSHLCAVARYERDRRN